MSQRLARCVAMWCDAQRRMVERCDAPAETIGEILRAFTPNAPPISETQAMPNPKSIML
jgi:hypothetical protein